MTFKTLTLLCGALIASGVVTQAHAADPDYTLGFNVGATSDYRFRGISQSRLDPAVFGGVDFAHKSGFYVGAWASSIKWIKDAGGSADAEIDLYAGFKGSAGAVGYDLGVLTYQYPGHSLAISPNTTELYGALTFGPVTAKYSHAVTNTFGFASSDNSGYLDISASFDLGKGWSIAPHVGHQRIAGTGNGIFSYTDYALALNYDFGNGLVATAAAIGSDAKKTSYFTPSGKGTGRDGLVLTLKYNF
jgi:uncharacterized protein (TIGR02001 family)